MAACFPKSLFLGGIGLDISDRSLSLHFQFFLGCSYFMDHMVAEM